MDIKNLNTFILVSELNSFTKAAEKSGYSQSTISFQIKQLERELNSQLFERINHTVALTEKGREVLKYAHQIHKLTQELETNMREVKNVKGHVRLAMADSLCDSLLYEGFSDFRAQYPGITLKIIAAGTEEMFRLLNHNEADAILTLDNHVYNTEYVIVREERVKINFVAAADSPLARRKNISVQELVHQPFILTEKGMSYRRLMDEKLAGISFLPDYMTVGKVEDGRLVHLQVDDFDVEVWKQLLYHRDKWVSPQMDSVMRYCVDREFIG